MQYDFYLLIFHDAMQPNIKSNNPHVTHLRIYQLHMMVLKIQQYLYII